MRFSISVQPKNAPFPILVTVAGIVTLVSAVLFSVTAKSFVRFFALFSVIAKA